MDPRQSTKLQMPPPLRRLITPVSIRATVAEFSDYVRALRSLQPRIALENVVLL